ncbi:MAG TPA: right-handed parallel beta-helix repeat-containing protein [Thermoanaerobaculia bacterium]|jgi:hypothetical protein|nr:right-handed parallel beta-helix repeat-containing protein [Thermoanaerobaculia bacterium]
MKKIVLSLTALAALLCLSSAAQAQATRTWVSGVGDDANPCSRTAPCKTFAGAISKTATAGEINVLDPGGFGGVTITKSITISSEGFEAGVLVSGTNAIIINAPTNANIVLRGLDIEGLGTGLAGIRVIAAGTVHVENCTINNFTQLGIDFAPAAAAASTSQLYVSNSIIRNNIGASSGGIRVRPGANVTAFAMIEGTQLRNNQFGLRADDNSKVTAKDTLAAGNAANGFIAAATASTVSMNLDSCVATGNTNGIRADNPGATIRLTNCTVVGNTNGLVSSTGPGNIVSFKNLYNADNGAPTATITPQ